MEAGRSKLILATYCDDENNAPLVYMKWKPDSYMNFPLCIRWKWCVCNWNGLT